jgi:glycosyltransferase involved in cell wall biosynthesis
MPHPVKPRISVPLPCKDAEETLVEALGSIVSQTYDGFEIIAINDASSDRTKRILMEWEKRDGRMRYLETQRHGIVNALRLAAETARGELLARMDADDIADTRRFEKQLRLLESKPDVAACGTLIRYFPRSKVRDGAKRYEAWINSVVSPAEIERDLFVECPIPHPTLMMRRQAYVQVGGYRDVGWPEDYDLILRLWQSGHLLGKVPEPLLRWRESPERLSRVDPRYGEDSFRRCKVHYLDTLVSGRRVVVCGAGPVGKAFALALLANGHTLAAFVDLDPRKIGQAIHGAQVVHPNAVIDFRDCYFFAAVGSAKGRSEIREMLIAERLKELDQFCAVA